MDSICEFVKTSQFNSLSKFFENEDFNIFLSMYMGWFLIYLWRKINGIPGNLLGYSNDLK